MSLLGRMTGLLLAQGLFGIGHHLVSLSHEKVPEQISPVVSNNMGMRVLKSCQR